jgi:hypothetical protein
MRKHIVGPAVLLAVFLIAWAGISSAASQGSVSEGNIAVYKQGKLSKKLTGINPVEEGSLIICQGKCLIRSHGVSIMAEDQAELAIADQDGLFNLFVRHGHVEFIISPSAQKIAFNTPDGVYSIADVIFNASSSSAVRGYMNVDEGGARVGVREGRMIFATDTGPKTVKADQQIILAMSDVEKPASGSANTDPVPAEEKKKKKRAGVYWWSANTQNMAIAGGIVLAAGAGIAYAASPGGYGGSSAPPSPSPSR